MKFEKLELRNFRQFAGEHTLEFPRGENKNVLVIYGANGAGKTTLLNAITWCLYGATTDALEDPTSLISMQALASATKTESVIAEVECTFAHEGERFIATREVAAKYSEDRKTWDLGEPSLKLKIVRADGQTHIPQEQVARQAAIDAILPANLYGYFFFDGERIERLTRRGGTDEIANAIASLLGLKVVERGIRHLRQHVRGALNEELAKFGDSSLKDILDDLNTKEDRRQSAITERDQWTENLREFRQEEEEVDKRFLELKETHDLQAQLNKAKDDRKVLREERKQRELELASAINGRGFLAFIPDLANRVCGLVNVQRERGRIPALYQQRFIQDLLETGKCICGTHIKQGSDHYKEVSGLLASGASSDAQTRAIEVASLAESLEDRRDDFMEAIRHLQRALKKNDDALARTAEAISAIEERQVSTKGTEEIQGLAAQRDKLREDADAANQKIGVLNAKIKEFDLDIADLEKKRAKAQVTDEKGRRVLERLEVERETSEFLEQLLTLRKEQVRTSIERRVKEAYAGISFKSYEPELTLDYELRLTNQLGGTKDAISYEVAKSTGENQILSLSFIGSVAAYARSIRERAGQGFQLGFPGGIYPLVMDSPFGSIDTNYRIAVADFLPQMADQVTVLVSKAQGSEEVATQLSGRTGKAYVLHFKTPKEEFVDEKVTINGKDYPYISKSNDGTESVSLVEVVA